MVVKRHQAPRCFPGGQGNRLPKVGGTKNPDVQKIIDLHPDLVIANREENTPETVKVLREAGLPVVVFFPQNVRQAVDDLWRMVGLFQSKEAALRLETLEQAYEWADNASYAFNKLRTFCPIWQGEGWWMTFNKHTYSHDVLRLAGGENIFADRERRYPLEADIGAAPPDPNAAGDTRYPRVTVAEVRALNPQVILLPSEPFPFDAPHREEIFTMLWDVEAVKNEKVYLVDGSLLTWHGTRFAQALQTLPGLFYAD